MIVLSRRIGESIVINNDITLTVVEIRGDKVRLAVTAPAGVPVHRQEVFDAIHGKPTPEWTPQPRSPLEAAFLRAVLADPADDAPRLIYADWLDEQGDPRGEFIRVQCRLAQLPPGDEAVRGLRRREQELLSIHERSWRSGLHALLRKEFFVRGFVESAHLSVREFLDHAGELLGSAPIRHLHLRPSGWSPTSREDIAALAASPYLSRLRALDLGQNGLGDEDVSRLVASAHLAGLAALLLRGNGIGDAGAAALARSPYLAGLAALDLAGNQIGTAGATALASSAHLGRLALLVLADNPVGVAGCLALRRRFGAVAEC
jgi:carbon storage regulator CsrA